MNGRMRAQNGFTLIELVVVVAILGILAAIAAPMVTNYIGNAKERAYSAEAERIQSAVDAYYADPGNVRFLGERQYPLIGRGQTDEDALDSDETTARELKDITLDQFADPPTKASGAALSAALWNPVGGIQGANLSATAVWIDDSDAVRDDLTSGSPDIWTTIAVTTLTGSTVQTDPRYFFIDFQALADGAYLDGIPESASVDNTPEGGDSSTYAGTYSWYVDSVGKVRSLYKEFPDTTSYIDAVFP